MTSSTFQSLFYLILIFIKRRGILGIIQVLIKKRVFQELEQITASLFECESGMNFLCLLKGDLTLET